MILNLYAGIGGNRHLWPDGDIVAVEHDPKIAAEYARRFPGDEVVVGDAHEYLKEHYARFDFIWSSPPCPTHSRMWGQNRTPDYPDMRLYQEILFLQRWAKGPWVVENVKPWYKPLIEPAGQSGRHVFWSNLPLWALAEPPATPKGFIKDATPEDIADYLGIEVVMLYCNGNHDPKQAMRNCVHPQTGRAIWDLYIANKEVRVSGSEYSPPLGSPRRIQRKRTSGWRMPDGAVYVGRPTKWGNPFGVHPRDGGREAATQLYRRWLDGEFPNTEPDRLAWIREHVHELRGCDLACWCPADDWCHADVLLCIANAQISGGTPSAESDCCAIHRTEKEAK